MGANYGGRFERTRPFSRMPTGPDPASHFSGNAGQSGRPETTGDFPLHESGARKLMSPAAWTGVPKVRKGVDSGWSRQAPSRLIVAPNTDASVRRPKGLTRPVRNEDARAIVMASLSMVDLRESHGTSGTIRRMTAPAATSGTDRRPAESPRIALFPALRNPGIMHNGPEVQNRGVRRTCDVVPTMTAWSAALKSSPSRLGTPGRGTVCSSTQPSRDGENFACHPGGRGGGQKNRDRA